MELLLRKWVEWKGRRKAAQVIIFDGAAEYEKTRSFARGVMAGALGMSVLFALTAPTAVDFQLLEEAQRRHVLVSEANQRTTQAVELAHLCLKTASEMDQTLTAYQKMLTSP
jgi:hypothetical protein